VSAAIPGLVLAAGASRRMGRPKALLPASAAGQPFVRVICDALAAAGVSPIVVVTRAELVAPLGELVPGIELAVNPDPDRGQLSSLLVGLDAVGPCDAVLVTLVDLPLVQSSTVAALLASWHLTQAPLVRPEHRGRHGHPVIFGAPLLHALRSADVELGAKPVVHRFAAQAVSVPVDDPGTVDDIDTPEAYDRLERP
jgi:CTP:molybdopterin cytidylyltransferase MocA